VDNIIKELTSHEIFSGSAWRAIDQLGMVLFRLDIACLESADINNTAFKRMRDG